MIEQTASSEQARLSALYKLSSQLGSSLDMSRVLSQVIDAILELTHADRGYIVLFDEVTGEWQPAVVRNLKPDKLAGKSMEVSRTVIERAIASGTGILTNNAQEDERFSAETSVVGYQLRSIMCAPLRMRDRILGAVYVDNQLFSGAFEQRDLELLEAFTNQAAIAIQNARLFTQTDQALNRRIEEISLFQRIDQQLNKSLDLNRVLRLALEWAVSLTKADGGSIGLFEPAEDGDGQVLRLLVQTGLGHDSVRLIPDDNPVLAQVLAEGKSVLVVGVSGSQAIDGTPAAEQLAVPIQRGGEITGLFTLESQQQGVLDEEDTAFVERLADRASVAIYNARLYEHIQSANKAKSDFISIVTHELRLPMTSIRGYADLMYSGMAGELNEQQMQFLGVIRRNLDRMSDLIRDLGDINRIESGRMKFESQKFDIRQTIDDVVDNLRKAIDARNQTVSVELVGDVPPVYADPTRTSQILTNLVSNAHKYTPDDGAVTIRALPDTDMLTIAVEDNGLGISEEDQDKLFTQFFRAESQEVRQQQGWGLGLSIVKKMVEAQGGEVSFESELGRGSTFTFTVPLARP